MKRSGGFRIIERTPLNEHGFLAIETRTVETPSGNHIDRFVVTHPGAVAVVALDGDTALLLEQYRAPIDRTILELPAGKLDQGDDDPVAAGKRELREETGYTARSWKILTSIWTSVGFCDERITILLAEDLSPGEREPQGAEEIAATIKRIPLRQAVEMVTTGIIADAKTAVGILIADADARTA
ncbi:MAG: NUDIX hydrolase [Acidimicrobiia bacterium]